MAGPEIGASSPVRLNLPATAAPSDASAEVFGQAAGPGFWNLKGPFGDLLADNTRHAGSTTFKQGSVSGSGTAFPASQLQAQDDSAPQPQLAGGATAAQPALASAVVPIELPFEGGILQTVSFEKSPKPNNSGPLALNHQAVAHPRLELTASAAIKLALTIDPGNTADLADLLKKLPPREINALQGQLEKLSPQHAVTAAKPLAAAIEMMKISGAQKSTLDGIVNIGSVVIAGLYAHRNGPKGNEIRAAIEAINRHLLKIPSGAAEANILKSFRGVTNEKPAARQRAINLARLVKSGVTPELWAGVLQRLKPTEILSLEAVFKALDPAVASLVARTFANATGKMRAAEARSTFVEIFDFGFKDEARNSKVPDAITQARQYLESASEILADRIRKEVFYPELDDTKAANLTRIVKAPTEQLAGAWLQFDAGERTTFHNVFMALPPQDAPVVATALAAAIHQIDYNEDKRQWAEAFEGFIVNHPEMSQVDRTKIANAILLLAK